MNIKLAAVMGSRCRSARATAEWCLLSEGHRFASR